MASGSTTDTASHLDDRTAKKSNPKRRWAHAEPANKAAERPTSRKDRGADRIIGD